MSATRSAAPSGASHLQWGGRHCDLACPRVLARSMIAAKYRLFSPEPKTSKFPRYAHTEEVAIPGISILGRHAISPGWSATLPLPGYGRVACYSPEPELRPDRSRTSS